jgi:uncharacterized protein (DUF3084 family)
LETGLILIFAVLLVGGVIATVGDRIGTRVGKARLSLFNLRPRNTATLVTILTGILVSASTLGILLASSGPLRKGIFEYEKIQRETRRIRRELEKTTGELQTARDQKTKTATELNKARIDEANAQKLLSETNKSLKGAIAESNKIALERNQANAIQRQARAELEGAKSQLATVAEQIAKLRSDIGQLRSERKRVIAEGEEEIKAKNAVIQEREASLSNLESKQDELVQEIARLDREADGLRRGNVAVQRGQVLASAIVRGVVEQNTSRQVVDRLLREANRTALRSLRPGTQKEDQIVQITRAEVEQLVNKINDGRDYLIRVSAAANYLVGETPIQVFSEAIVNQLVFRQGEVVAASTIDPSTLSNAQIQQRLQLLAAAASFRARRAGILTDQVQIDIPKALAFIEKLQQYKQTLELRLVVAENTFVSGPLQVELVAADNGKILLRSQPTPQPSPSP